MEKYDVEVDERGTVRYYKKGTKELHCLSGPAVICKDGRGIRRYYYQHDKLHRLDGPAVVYAGGSKVWFIEGKGYTEREFNMKVVSMNTKELTDDIR